MLTGPLAGGLSFLSHEPLPRAAWVSSWNDAGFPYSKGSKRKQDKRQGFHSLISHTLFFSSTFLITHVSFVHYGRALPSNPPPTQKPFTSVWIIEGKDHWGPFGRSVIMIPFHSFILYFSLSFNCTHYLHRKLYWLLTQLPFSLLLTEHQLINVLFLGILSSRQHNLL